MSQVDGIGASTRTERAVEQQTPRTGESFDVIFALAQQSAQTNEDEVQRARGRGESFQRHQQVIDSLSESNRSDDIQKAEADAHSNASRVDRLRDNAQSESNQQALESPTQARQQRISETDDARAEGTSTNAADHNNAVMPRTSNDALVRFAPAQQSSVIASANNAATNNAPATLIASNGAAATPTNGANQTTADQPYTSNIPSSTGMVAASTQQSNSGGATLEQASTAVKAVTATVKAATPTTNYQNVLQGAQNGKSNGPATAKDANAARGTTYTVDLNRSESTRDLARIIRTNLNQNHSTLTMRLDPAELGSVRIDVRMEHEKLTLHIETETLAGKEALQSKLGELKQTLEQHGISVQQAEIEVRATVTPGDEAPDTTDHDDSQTQYADTNQHDEQSSTNDHDQTQAIWHNDDVREYETNEDDMRSEREVGTEAERTGFNQRTRPAETGVNVVV